MLISYKDRSPRLGERCYTADSAAVIGDVTLGDDVSVWFGASVRGDAGPVTVGHRSNIQDNATVHCSDGGAVTIGADVSVGHNAVVHGATVEDGVLIGMGAVVLDGAVIGAGSTVAAGALVTKGMEIPPCSLVMGVPGKVVRAVPAGANLENAAIYVEKKDNYRKEGMA